MTTQEAIYWLIAIEDKYIHGGDEGFDEQRKTALNLARDALYKRVPMKPVGDLHSVPHYRCKSCGSAVVVYENGGRYPHCQWCGQKLDWD